MSERTLSISLAQQFSIPENTEKDQGYYRSKLLITSASSNPLIAAATPLFSVLERLNTCHTMPTIDEISSNLQHELNAFRSRLLRKGYTGEFSAIALFLISATIDELLAKNHLRLFGKPAEFSAFTPVTHPDKGPEILFFEIIEQLKLQASHYLDIIELGYYCLISGFEGTLHVQATGRQTLENLIEELYQLICQYRVEKPTPLPFKSQPEVIKPKQSKRFFMGITIGVVSLMILGVIANQVIEQKSSHVLHALLYETPDSVG